MIRRCLAIAVLLAFPCLLGLLHQRLKHRLVPQARGMVLGLYAGVPDYDYGPELSRIAGSGANAVSIQAIYRMERHDSVEVVRHPTSSPTEVSLRRTFRQARARGLRMMFFPTINLRDEAANATWWRGNIEPRDWDLWWRNYMTFNVRLARLAQEEGVEWYSVGTEMESTHRFPDRWRELIRAVRQVFKGRVTYSVNFNAHDAFTFGDGLDVIGINTYDPIAKRDRSPTDDQIRDAWWWIVYKARTLEARFHRPVMITEVGYPSVAMAHAGPWDFRTSQPADPVLQNRLVLGALRVLRNWGDGEAVFYYLYGENLARGVVPGEAGDRTYAPWGKPVEASLRWYFAEPIYATASATPPELVQEAVTQSLLAAGRKNLRYEDGALPRWVEDWKRVHPEDWARVEVLLAAEPRPAGKIPKGQEASPLASGSQ
jgi:hypothetical protein